jgi:4-hydroxy-tetrahydrodipicolinate synthase
MFKGVYTALVTPFLENGNIDEETLRKLVNFQIEEGITGIVPMGSTGESPCLNHDEHIEVIKIVIDECKGRVPVIAGTGSNSTKEAVALTIRAKEAGADASLQVSPYYNKPTQTGLFNHFNTIADETDFPLIVYNIPGRSGININNETMLKLARNKNIAAVKDATGNFNQLMELIAEKPDKLDILSGDDNITYPFIALGACGVISVASNILPGEMIKYVDTCLTGNLSEARKVHYRLLPLFTAMFLETNPIPVKTAMSMQGKLKEIFRSPLCKMAPGNKEKLKSVLKTYGII